ncbi:MAG: carbohydrate ABC transporter permease [Actinomycetota bacterium]
MTTTDPPPGGAPVLAAPEAPPARGLWVALLRVAGALAIPVTGFLLLWLTFDYLRDAQANRIMVVGVAILVGVVGVFILYWAMNRVVDLLPARYREGVRPYIFVGPALVILSVFLIYPVVNTILLSLKDAQGESFVGLENFSFVFTDDAMLRAIRNTAGWVILVPLVTVGIGLAFATLADRLRRGEAVAKSMIFLPMAISFAGASVTWRLVYSFRPEGFGSNIGLLNGIMLGLGQEPVSWIDVQPWNNLLLMVILVWMQTGFSMVVLSAAIKSIPDEIIEAARIDGASELQVFRSIIIPTILPTIVVVATYTVINSLKVFDIIFVMTGGNFGTEVIAERMIRWFFISGHDGRGAAIAVVLFVVIIPIMIWNIRRFREQEETR